MPETLRRKGKKSRGDGSEDQKTGGHSQVTVALQSIGRASCSKTDGLTELCGMVLWTCCPIQQPLSGYLALEMWQVRLRNYIKKKSSPKERSLLILEREGGRERERQQH